MNVLLCDGTYLLRRYSHSKGDPHPYGPAARFLECLSEHIRNASEVHVCWDHGEPKRLREIYPEYKIGRKKRADNPDTIRALERFDQNKPQLVQLLPTLGVFQQWAPNLEADDVIAQHVRQYGRAYFRILSGDYDLIQLLDWRITQPGVQAFEHPDGKTTLKNSKVGTTGVQTQNWLVYKVLMGDASDSIPGLKNIGKVRAARLVTELPWHVFHSVDFSTRYHEGPGEHLIMILEAAQAKQPEWLASKDFDALRAPGVADVLIRNLKLMDLADRPLVAITRIDPLDLFYSGPDYELVSTGNPMKARDILLGMGIEDRIQLRWFQSLDGMGERRRLP